MEPGDLRGLWSNLLKLGNLPVHIISYTVTPPII